MIRSELVHRCLKIAEEVWADVVACSDGTARVDECILEVLTQLEADGFLRSGDASESSIETAARLIWEHDNLGGDWDIAPVVAAADARILAERMRNAGVLR